MNIENQCPRCLKQFSSKRRFLSHLENQINCNIKSLEFICNICHKKFLKKAYLVKHSKIHENPLQTHMNLIGLKINNVTSVPKKSLKLNDKLITKEIIGHIIEQNQKFVELIEEQNHKIGQQNQKIGQQNQKICELIEKQNLLIEKPTNIINNLNNLKIICIGNNDNYLDMLTKKWGFDRALEYIKDCALSNLTGDCKLIEKIYINDYPNSIHYSDKKKNKVQYFDENQNQIIDSLSNFGKKIANNLQNSYLKGVNHLVNETLDNHRCPNEFLENYDLRTWNQHIYDLSNPQYHKTIINNLNIF